MTGLADLFIYRAVLEWRSGQHSGEGIAKDFHGTCIKFELLTLDKDLSGKECNT